MHRVGAMGRLLDAGASRAQGHPTSLPSVGKRPRRLSKRPRLASALVAPQIAATFAPASTSSLALARMGSSFGSLQVSAPASRSTADVSVVISATVASGTIVMPPVVVIGSLVAPTVLTGSRSPGLLK